MTQTLPEWFTRKVDEVFAELRDHSTCVAQCRADYQKCLASGENAANCRDWLKECFDGCNRSGSVVDINSILPKLIDLEEELARRRVGKTC